MNTAQVAAAVTDMLKAGDDHGAAERFHSPDIVSIEAMEGPMARVEGTAAVQAKSVWWYDNHEVHNMTTQGPYVNGDSFVVMFEMDITVKATGERTQWREAALYTVKDGKIAEERFFY